MSKLLFWSSFMNEETKTIIRGKVGKKATVQLGRDISRKRRVGNFFLRHYYPFLVFTGIVAAVPILGVAEFVAMFTAANLIGPTIVITAAVIAVANRLLIFRKRKTRAGAENKIYRKEKRLNKKHRKFENAKRAYKTHKQISDKLLSGYKALDQSKLDDKQKRFNAKLLKKDYAVQQRHMLRQEKRMAKLYNALYKTTNGSFAKTVDKYIKVSDSMGARYKRDKDKNDNTPLYRGNLNNAMYALSKEQSFLAEQYDAHKELNKEMRKSYQQGSPRLKNKIAILEQTKKLDASSSGLPFARRSARVQKALYNAKRKHVAFDTIEYETEIASRNKKSREQIFGPLTSEQIVTSQKGVVKEKETPVVEEKPVVQEKQGKGSNKGGATETPEPVVEETKTPKKQEVKQKTAEPVSTPSPKNEKKQEPKDVVNEGPYIKHYYPELKQAKENKNYKYASYKNGAYYVGKSKKPIFAEDDDKKRLEELLGHIEDSEELKVRIITNKEEHNFGRVQETIVKDKPSEPDAGKSL